MISDDRLKYLIDYTSGTPSSRDIREALRELQQWRRVVEPSTGDPIGKLVVMQDWTEDTDPRKVQP